MKRVPSGELQPAQAAVLRMQALQLELQRARQHLRRERRAQGAGARWGLEQDGSQQHQDEEWLITYLDMVTLLMVAMIMMLALAGPIGRFRDAARHAAGPLAAAQPHASPARLPPIPPPPDAYPYPAAPIGAFMQFAQAAVTTAPRPRAPAAEPADLPAQTLAVQTQLPDDAQSASADLARVETQVAWAPTPVMPAGPGPTPVSPAPSGPATPSASSSPEAAVPASAGKAAAAEPSEGAAVAASLDLGELGKDVEVIVNRQSVSFRVNSEILFDTGQTELSPAGLTVLKRMAQVLVPAGYDITVEGYTDSVPVRSNAPYPSNWELSSARAGSVVRYLVANGIPKSHLRAVGFADSRPIADNRTPEGRARNRRVELVVSKHHAE